MTDEEIKNAISAIHVAHAEALLAQAEKTSDQSLIERLSRKATERRQHAERLLSQPLSAVRRLVAMAHVEVYRGGVRAATETS